MERIALSLGVLVALQGVIGLVAPDLLVETVRFFRASPTIYFAAVVRIAFGLVLVRAASQARAPVALRVLGIAIVAGGALTPFIGAQFAQIVLGWWAEGGAPVVRVWAFASLVIGAFIIYATIPNSPAAKLGCWTDSHPRTARGVQGWAIQVWRELGAKFAERCKRGP